MDKLRAKEIIAKHQLVSGKEGRRLLHAIEQGLSINPQALPIGVTIGQIDRIRELFNKKKQEIENKVPRNLIFYHLIKELTPEFYWKIKSTFNSNVQVEINSSKINGLRPSLFSLLLNKISDEFDSPLHSKYYCVQRLPNKMIKALSVLMEKIEVIYPKEEEMNLIVDWILKGFSGEEIFLFSPVCPDYSAEATGDPTCPFRHTFDQLGSGVGIIAKRILAALPHIVNFFEKFKLKLNVIVGVGDFEAFSSDNLNRLNISKNEFLSRVTSSVNNIAKMISVDGKIILITDLCGGENGWFQEYYLLLKMLQTNDFGSSGLTKNKLVEIVRKRKNLYDRWYGKKKISDHIPSLIKQAAEYATIGGFISKSKKNTLILGADNNAMSVFYNINQPIPSLYLKRFYC